MVNQQRNDAGLREIALFAGAGGGILGGHLLGWRTVCAVEYNAYARSVLLARQNDGTLPPFPVWDDVRTFRGEPWRGIVDVVSGGFPCQDISVAGAGAGIDGERSGLWSHMARIIGEVRPRYAFIENSPMLTDRGLDRVLADLAKMGFDAEWGVLSAADTGAPHLRERIWIVANSQCAGLEGASRTGMPRTRWKTKQPAGSGSQLANTMRQHEQGIISSGSNAQEWSEPRERQIGPCGYGFRPWPTESGMGRVVSNGLASRADRLKAAGNGQVPRVVAAAWRIISR